MKGKKVAPAGCGWGRGAVLSHSQGCSVAELIRFTNLVLTPLQTLKTCPEKSLQLILPLYVKL